MAKVLEFPADRMAKGVHAYWPEMKERKVNAQIEASLCYGGKHYNIYTKLKLKGRGITQRDTGRSGVNCYRVTWNAFDKLQQQYSISMERLLD